VDKRNASRILVGNPEGKRPVRRPRRKLEDNIKMDLREIGWGGMSWIHLAQNRDQWRALVNTVMNLMFHKLLGKSLVTRNWRTLKTTQPKVLITKSIS
jgi:hypothetical protein